MDTKIINWKIIEFDPEVQSEIYKLLLPDGGSGDANLFDWSIVITSILMEAGLPGQGIPRPSEFYFKYD